MENTELVPDSIRKTTKNTVVVKITQERNYVLSTDFSLLCDIAGAKVAVEKLSYDVTRAVATEKAIDSPWWEKMIAQNPDAAYFQFDVEYKTVVVKAVTYTMVTEKAYRKSLEGDYPITLTDVSSLLS